MFKRIHLSVLDNNAPENRSLPNAVPPELRPEKEKKRVPVFEDGKEIKKLVCDDRGEKDFVKILSGSHARNRYGSGLISDFLCMFRQLFTQGSGGKPMMNLLSFEMMRSLLTWEGKALALFFGAGILPWPLLSMGALFMFDSPIVSSADGLRRYAFAYLIWLYPVLYGCSMLLYLFMRKEGVSRVLCDLILCIPGLTPVYSIWFFRSRS